MVFGAFTGMPVPATIKQKRGEKLREEELSPTTAKTPAGRTVPDVRWDFLLV